MKAIILILAIGLLSGISHSQTIKFDKEYSVNPLISSLNGFDGIVFAFADIDGDNDQDLLIGTYDHAVICKNDGQGKFEMMPQKLFVGSQLKSINFEHVNGDNHLDLLITGIDEDGKYFIKLYKNDGDGNFLELTENYFEAASQVDVAFADIDGDNDQDLVIVGSVTKVYENDGYGKFSEKANSPFESLDMPSVAFADIDGDDDQDLLLSGRNSSLNYITKLYKNDSKGNFSEVSGTPFIGAWKSSIAFADIDGDSDQDVFITGQNNSGSFSYLYKNDGYGSFARDTGSHGFMAFPNASIAFADVDGDNDYDLLISGSYRCDLYENDGKGNFSKMNILPFQGVNYPYIGFCDTDLDGDLDLLVCGLASSGLRITKLYSNDGKGSFYEFKKKQFDGIAISSVAFSDVDGDNDQDVLISGWTEDLDSRVNLTNLYVNDGTGNFTLALNNDFEVVSSSTIVFADVDGDGDQDVLISGINNSNDRSIKLYENDGEGVFSEKSNTPFVKVYMESIAFSDIDGDGDLDLMISGNKTNNLYSRDNVVSELYVNDGAGNFTKVYDSNILGVCDGDIAFSDIDGDNDNDLLITGTDYSLERRSKLYRNDGTGKFEEVINTNFEAVSQSSIAFADIDGDGDQDVLITGDPGGSWRPTSLSTKLYKNDGNGNFSVLSDTQLERVSESAIRFFDADGDGDMDLLISGYNGKISHMTSFYENNGNGQFAEISSTIFEGVNFPKIAIADVNCDGDTDIFIAGKNGTGHYISNLYENTTCIPKSLVPLLSSLPDITESCSVEQPNPPLARNCNGEVIGLPNVDFPIIDQSISEIVWSYDDNYGNLLEQIQKINWTPIDVSIINDSDALRVSNNYDAYQWINCKNNQVIVGATTSKFYAESSGSYAVVITDKSCREISDCFNLITTGLDKPSFNSMKIYPNPTKDFIFISFCSECKEFTLYNQSGYKLDAGNIIDNKIDLSSYETGIYFLNIGDELFKVLKLK